MKNNFTIHSRITFLVMLLFSSMNLFAQPANDDCSTPTPITLAADQASCVWFDGDTRMAVDATIITTVPAVCSGSWYIDDVWFSFTTGATVSTGGLIVETDFGTNPDDVSGIGMSFYTNSCDPDNIEYDGCFSSGDGSTRSLVLPCDIAPNTSYLVRVWSGGNTVDTEGTFTICAYEAPPIPIETAVVVWETDFNNDDGGWTSSTPTDTLTDVWVYDEEGKFSSFYGAGQTVSINGPNNSVCTGAWGFTGDWFQAHRTGNFDLIPASNALYEDYNSDFTSPMIDLSGVTAAEVSLKFDQRFSRLNANPGADFASVEYTVDGGTTWSAPIPLNSDVGANDDDVDNTVRIPLLGAVGSSEVQVRFLYQGDFYYWIIDRVQIIEREAHNMQANEFYSIAPNLLTPMSQVDTVRFLIDVENIGSQEQDGVNVNMTVVNSASAEVYNEDVAYGSVASSFVDENRIFPLEYVAPASIDTYNATYTVSADSTDFDLTNNTQSFEFFVTDSVFAKENNVDIFGVTSPAATTELTWTIASTYFVTHEEDPTNSNLKYECTSVLVGLGNLTANVGGFVTIYLYEWEDVNNDDIAQSDERDGTIGGATVGNYTYEILDGVTNELDLLVALENFVDGGEPILLKANTTYVLAAGLTSAGVSKISARGNDENNYEATAFLTDSIGVRRISCLWNTTSDDGGFNNPLDQVVFNPRMRMHINEFDASVSVNNPLDEANKVNVYPNPASEVVNMELDLVENLNNAVVRIVDLNARNVMEVVYQDLSSQTLTYSVANLASGTYFLKIQSDKGYITKKFTIVK